MNEHKKKPIKGFLSDVQFVNLLQVTPRLNHVHKEQRSPYTMINAVSKTNFIGDSVILSDTPRAVTVSKTGERHTLSFVDNIVGSPSNMTTIGSLNLPKALLSKISEDNSSKLPTNVTEDSKICNEQPVKKKTYSHRYKISHRHSNHKQRMIFSPRINEKSGPFIPIDPIQFFEKSTLKMSNAQTQTDTTVKELTHTKSVQVTCDLESMENLEYLRQQKQQHLYKITSAVESTLTPKIVHLNANDRKKSTSHLLKHSNRKLYSELRGIATFVTLITVTIWIFSIYYGLDGISELLNCMVNKLQMFYSFEEKPKTKAEIFLQFLRDIWTA